ncbi:MAG: DUF1329 domain-containing protein, partial [Pseudomonadota bacterium]
MRTSSRVGWAALGLLWGCFSWASDFDTISGWFSADQVIPAKLQSAGRLSHADHELLRTVMPPKFVELFDFDELRLEIQPTTDLGPHQTYLDVTARHAGTASLAADGTLQGYVAGLPFSRAQLDAASAAHAGHMVAWNHIFRWNHYGYRSSDLTMFYFANGSEGTAALPEGFSGGGQLQRTVRMMYHRVIL